MNTEVRFTRTPEPGAGKDKRCLYTCPRCGGAQVVVVWKRAEVGEEREMATEESGGLSYDRTRILLARYADGLRCTNSDTVSEGVQISRHKLILNTSEV